MDLNTKFILISTIVVLMVIILANVELYYNKIHCKYYVDMPKQSMVILPKHSGLNYPVYVYDKSKIKKRDLDYQLGFNSNNYIKKKIPEHVASKIATPILEITSGIKNLSKTKTPINSLYSFLGKSDDVIGNANPLTCIDTSNFRMLVNKNDALTEAFFAGGKLFFV